MPRNRKNYDPVRKAYFLVPSKNPVPDSDTYFVGNRTMKIFDPYSKAIKLIPSGKESQYWIANLYITELDNKDYCKECCEPFCCEPSEPSYLSYITVKNDRGVDIIVAKGQYSERLGKDGKEKAIGVIDIEKMDEEFIKKQKILENYNGRLWMNFYREWIFQTPLENYKCKWNWITYYVDTNTFVLRSETPGNYY